MVGNDVVDLGDRETQPESCHPRFDARVFAAPEREALAASPAPWRLRWVLWAAKEAAFKVAKKRDATTVFVPHRLVVHLTREGGARVELSEQSFAVTLDVQDCYVHAVATTGAVYGAPVCAVASLVAVGVPCPSDAARALAIARVAARLRVATTELAIVRAGRVPHLVRGCGGAVGDLSLSHHGRFVACAWAPLDAVRGSA